MSQTHKQLIDTFYTAFAQRDSAGMAACYHPEVVFHDPVFATLKGWKAAAMWKMLCERGKDLRIEFRDVRADETSGGAAWEAWYTFSATGKSVHNKVKAEFAFADGKIVKHTDEFNLTAWMGMALALRENCSAGCRRCRTGWGGKPCGALMSTSPNGI